MPRNRFVASQKVRLELSDSDWIEVKAHLSYGDFLSLQTAGLTGVSVDAVFGRHANGAGVPRTDHQARVDMQRWMVEVFSIWIVDWSFQDENGKQRPVSRDAIKALDVETANEISEAIALHEVAIEEAKKATSTTSAPVPTST